MPNANAGSGLPANVDRTVVTVGTFDGVHLGHQDVLKRLVAPARSLGTPSGFVTFAPPLLSVGDERLEVLAESGVDYVAVLPFTATLAGFTPELFVDEVLLAR